jgi:hypothetical protein
MLSGTAWILPLLLATSLLPEDVPGLCDEESLKEAKVGRQALKSGSTTDLRIALMGYRRKAEDVPDKKRYAQFRRATESLVEELGVPTFALESHDHFIYLLMHGDFWPGSPISFNTFALSPEKYGLWVALVDAYLATGLSSPGLACMLEKDRLALEKKYPHCFASSFRKRPWP